MLIEHDMQAVMGVRDHHRDEFRHAARGRNAGQVRANPAVIEAYLGSAGDAA